MIVGYEHAVLKFLGELPLKFGMTLTLAVILFGVYFFMARERAKHVPVSVFAVFLTTLILYLVLIFHESRQFEWMKLWEQAYLWTKFLAYLGTSYFFMKAVDLLLVEDYFIAKKGAHIPELVRFLLLIFGLVAAALILLRTVMGIDVVALVAIPTVAAAMIGFALQDTLKRLFAGLILGKVIRIGDWVSVAGTEGRVVKMDHAHVSIVTRADDLVMIPNDVAVQKDILDYNKPTPKHALTVLVEATYDAPPLRVRAVLVETAKGVPGVLHNPTPKAFPWAYKDSSIEYRLKFWFNDYVQADDLKGEVLTYVWYAFKRHHIEIPYPQRTIHMTKAEESEQGRVRERQRNLEALREIDFLAVLSPEELEKVAHGAEIRTYLPGETVIHQGENTAAEFFLIHEGNAEVCLEEEGESSVIATVWPGQFFGELSLLTGEPRSATIVAKTRLEVLVLTKDVFARPLMMNPVLAERISEALVKRKADMTAKLKDHALHHHESDSHREEVRSLSASIRKFFGIA